MVLVLLRALMLSAPDPEKLVLGQEEDERVGTCTVLLTDADWESFGDPVGEIDTL